MPASISFTLLLILAGAAGSVLLLQRRALKQARARCADSQRLAAARGRSLALAAQELRGIAAGLSGWDGLASVPAKWRGETVQGPAERLLRLADDLAEVAAIPGPRVIHEGPAPLGPIVDAAIALVDRQIRPGRRHWQVDQALRVLTVRADRRALEGALAALLRRAASHSRDGDAIVLRWVVASETVAIVVEDEGDGLAAHDLGAEQPAALPGTRGLDLGLSLARSLAAAHGGDVRLESAPGIGARAWLTLPRARLLEPA
ncbi:sensor histidine kinase [Falsiroseomonas sp. HW251]|uniref:sensor histidine kinase n=1 Tax=Falsiroseomonas sp. HW251 TaxID=3390998 RepID=UPI003D3219B0